MKDNGDLRYIELHKLLECVGHYLKKVSVVYSSIYNINSDVLLKKLKARHVIEKQ